MRGGSGSRKTPSPDRRSPQEIAHENAAWASELQDSNTESDGEPVYTSPLSSEAHWSQGKLKIVSTKNRLTTSWIGRERAIGLVQYGQDDHHAAEDRAWAPDPVPESFPSTSCESDLVLHELRQASDGEPQSPSSGSPLPEANGETRRAVQEAMDAIRAANMPKPPPTEAEQLRTLKAQIMAYSGRRVEKWLANEGEANALNPFTADYPPSDCFFVIDDWTYGLAWPEPVYLRPLRFDAADEQRFGSPLRRYVGFPSKDVAPYIDIQRQLQAGNVKSDRMPPAYPPQAH